MRRREFITGLGGAAASFPFAARAQQPQHVRRIGVLMGTEENEPEGQSRIAAFRQGLRELGWVDGRNIQIEYRWSSGPRQAAYAAELVGIDPRGDRHQRNAVSRCRAQGHAFDPDCLRAVERSG